MGGHPTQHTYVLLLCKQFNEKIQLLSMTILFFYQNDRNVPKVKNTQSYIHI
jgi:hypothetical protein